MAEASSRGERRRRLIGQGQVPSEDLDLGALDIRRDSGDVALDIQHNTYVDQMAHTRTHARPGGGSGSKGLAARGMPEREKGHPTPR